MGAVLGDGPVGAVAGGGLRGIAGSKIGEAVWKGGKGGRGKAIVDTAAQVVKDVAEGAVEAVKSVARALNPLHWFVSYGRSFSFFNLGDYVMADPVKHTSVGTIRYECEYEDEESPVKWFFVPDTNHCVKHYKNEYAIFLNVGRTDEAISMKLPESGKGVTLSILGEKKIHEAKSLKCSDLKVPELFSLLGAQSAAMSQSKVMVIVEKNEGVLSLIGVFPPPK